MLRLATPAAAAASGLMLWAASPAVGLGWLAWLALVPAGAAAFAGSRWALPLALGISLELLLVPALPFGVAARQWADEPIAPVLVADSPVLFAALVAVPAVTAALGVLRFPLLGTRSVLVAAAAWTALDLLRAKLDPSGLWGTLFLTQHDQAAAALAALGGPWLATFVLVAANLGLARLRGAPLPAIGALALAAAAVTTAVAALPERPASRTVVAAVQPGYDTAEFDRPLLRFHRERRYAASAAAIVADLAPLVRRAADAGAAVVVLPEGVVWIDPREVRPLRRLALGTRSSLVVPFFLRESARSAALAVRPDGSATRVEPKHRPMWFVGERGGDGPPRPLDVPAGRVGTMLGVDTQDAAVARALADAGADLLTSSTHDWRGLAPHHRAYARLAAVAVGRPLVRADWRYGSAVYDAGRAAADAGDERRRTVVVARVAPAADTSYVRLGDVLGWGALAAAAVGAGAAIVRRRRSGG